MVKIVVLALLASASFAQTTARGNRTTGVSPLSNRSGMIAPAGVASTPLPPQGQPTVRPRVNAPAAPVPTDEVAYFECHGETAQGPIEIRVVDREGVTQVVNTVKRGRGVPEADRYSYDQVDLSYKKSADGKTCSIAMSLNGRQTRQFQLTKDIRGDALISMVPKPGEPQPRGCNVDNSTGTTVAALKNCTPPPIRTQKPICQKIGDYLTKPAVQYGMMNKPGTPPLENICTVQMRCFKRNESYRTFTACRPNTNGLCAKKPFNDCRNDTSYYFTDNDLDRPYQAIMADLGMSTASSAPAPAPTYAPSPAPVTAPPYVLPRPAPTPTPAPRPRPVRVRPGIPDDTWVVDPNDVQDSWEDEPAPTPPPSGGRFNNYRPGAQ